MANKTFEVALLLTAKDKASRIIDEATTKSRERIERMSKLGSKAFGVGMGAGAVGLGFAGILAAPLKAAADMESMNIALKTSFQGNEKAAKEAFDNINKFAAQTPYELQEVMTGFIKLKNMGLDPSQEALTAYGNTASAMGKSLNDMVEAVADAATGEFERLKEFGIKASSEGDKVTFLFQGVKTTVGKNAKEIEQYLKFVGNVKFKGGIEAQSKSLNGMLSTLKDSVVMTASKIGTTMIPRVKELFDKISPVLDKIQKWVEKNPKLTETLLKVIAGAMVLSFVTSGLAFAFGGVFKAIQAVLFVSSLWNKAMLVMKAGQMAFTMATLSGATATGSMTAALTAMNLAFLASPITWIILGIVALIAIGYAVIKNWDKVKEFFIKIWEYIKGVFHRFFQFLNTTFLKYSPAVLIYNNWSKITAFFGKIWETVKNIFIGYWSFFFNLYKKFFEFGSNIVTGLWNGIKQKLAPLYDFVKGIGKKIADTFKFILGIQSPSKVFMEFGTNITEGTKKGIEKGQSGVIGATKGMGKSISPGSSGGGRSSSGGINVTFAPVINGGGNSQDIMQQMKALVPYLIREIESAMERKNRLSY